MSIIKKTFTGVQMYLMKNVELYMHPAVGYNFLIYTPANFQGQIPQMYFQESLKKKLNLDSSFLQAFD